MRAVGRASRLSDLGWGRSVVLGAVSAEAHGTHTAFTGREEAVEWTKALEGREVRRGQSLVVLQLCGGLQGTSKNADLTARWALTGGVGCAG
jgi:hypothetical protein